MNRRFEVKRAYISTKYLRKSIAKINKARDTIFIIRVEVSAERHC
jgi:hypothetical protein